MDIQGERFKAYKEVITLDQEVYCVDINLETGKVVAKYLIKARCIVGFNPDEYPRAETYHEYNDREILMVCGYSLTSYEQAEEACRELGIERSLYVAQGS